MNTRCLMFLFCFLLFACQNYNKQNLLGKYTVLNFNNTYDTIQLENSNLYYRTIHYKNNNLLYKDTGTWRLFKNEIMFSNFYLNLDDDLISLNDSNSSMEEGCYHMNIPIVRKNFKTAFRFNYAYKDYYYLKLD